jgi:hypothetical protein
VSAITRESLRRHLEDELQDYKEEELDVLVALLNATDGRERKLIARNFSEARESDRGWARLMESRLLLRAALIELRGGRRSPLLPPEPSTRLVVLKGGLD